MQGAAPCHWTPTKVELVRGCPHMKSSFIESLMVAFPVPTSRSIVPSKTVKFEKTPRPPDSSFQSARELSGSGARQNRCCGICGCGCGSHGGRDREAPRAVGRREGQGALYGVGRGVGCDGVRVGLLCVLVRCDCDDSVTFAFDARGRSARRVLCCVGWGVGRCQ